MEKIHMFIATLRSGGSERVCSTLASLFAESGVETNLIVGNLKDERYLNSMSSKVKVYNINILRPRYSFLSLRKYIIKQKPLAVFIFSAEFIPYLVLLKIIYGYPKNIYVRNRSIVSEKKKISIEKKAWGYFLRNSIINFFYKRADKVINQSHAMEKDFLENYPSLAGRTIVINNPVSQQVENYAKAKNLHILRAREDYILCVARLDEVKALHYAISTFAKIQGRLPDYRLVIIGEGPLKNDLHRLVGALGLKSKVDFLGYRNDVESFYYNARLTLLTSLHEGFPNALIESIVCGTPVVSFDSPSGPKELLEDGRWGKLVKLGDTDELGQAILDCIEKPYPLDLKDRAKDFYSNYVLDEYKKTFNIL